MSIDLWKGVSYDPERINGLYHTLGHLGPEVSFVQSPQSPRALRTHISRISGKLGLIAPLLDSLVSLLPYHPHNQPQFAGTLALSKKSACLFVSADDDSQLDLALQDTTTINRCWDLIQTSINNIERSATTVKQLSKSELVRNFIIHHLNSGRQHSRFRKRSRECAAWFAFIRTCHLEHTDLADKSYLDTLEKVFILYEHAIASGVWIDEDLVKLCEYAEAIKCFEKQSRKREARPPVFCYFRQFQQCKLDATLPLPLNDLPHQWDFNGVRYIKKLIQPALRAIELYRLSKRSTFRKMFKGRSLNITGVRAGDHGIRRSGSINIDAICKLIHEIPSQPEDQETLIAQIRAALHHTDGDIVLRSHPECNLLRYHDGGRPYVERPFPYIATNKMPCIACGHFVHYHRHLVQWESKEQVGFFLRGWKDRIELDWCFPATDPDHIYSRQIGIQMHNGLVKVLRKRMDVMRKYRAIQERKQSSRW